MLESLMRRGVKVWLSDVSKQSKTETDTRAKILKQSGKDT